jgi:hypothetical protein
MILERMGQGQNLDSWMYSQITLAVDQLNSVHDTMDGTDGKKEEIKEEKVYIDYLNKQKGFKQDRIKFNSYEEAVKWAKKNFEKFNSDMIKYESVNEEKPGLWANIRAKQARGEKPAHGNSDAHKDAVKAGKEINNEEAVNELTNNERQIKTGNPNNVFYAFYKGQFEAVYWAMNPTDLIKIYWDKFKVRRPAGSKFKFNPEFIIVPKKEYDKSTSNRYAKLKPYVDKFWDKLQNESADVNQNAVMASIEDLPNNRTQKNFPLPTNRILWNATGKVCEGRPVVERIKMYEKKGGGWREGIADDEQVYNSIKELHSERKQVEEIKESVRAILKKKVQTESKLNEDISDIVMSGLQMIGIAASGFFLRFLFRYMIGEFLKASKDTTMNGMKSIIQGVKNAWSSLKNMSRIRQLEKELENDEDIQHAVSHPRTIDFAKVLKKKLDPKDYDLISKITRNNFR